MEPIQVPCGAPSGTPWRGRSAPLASRKAQSAWTAAVHVVAVECNNDNNNNNNNNNNKNKNKNNNNNNNNNYFKFLRPLGVEYSEFPILVSSCSGM